MDADVPPAHDPIILRYFGKRPGLAPICLIRFAPIGLDRFLDMASSMNPTLRTRTSSRIGTRFSERPDELRVPTTASVALGSVSIQVKYEDL